MAGGTMLVSLQGGCSRRGGDGFGAGGRDGRVIGRVDITEPRVSLSTRRSGGPSGRRSPKYERGGYGDVILILCIPAAHGRDLTLVPVLGRGRPPCFTLPLRGTAGARAGVARVRDL